MGDELQLAPDALRNVRYSAVLEKRSPTFPSPWRSRFVVLSANFLFIYVTEKVRAQGSGAAF